MADLRKRIQNGYGIDIDEENVIQLYRIEDADVTPEDLEEKIQATRKRWNTSINGANEKYAARDRARLEKAEQYEAILKDKKLRTELFRYYRNKSASGAGGTKADAEAADFAVKFFSVTAGTGKIEESDLDFFFRYFRAERKSKKAVLEALGGRFTLPASADGQREGAGSGTEKSGDGETEGKEGAGSRPGGVLGTPELLSLRKALDFFEDAAASDTLREKYPGLSGTLYDFLGMDGIDGPEQFREYVTEKANETYAVRQERGTEYVPLVDLYNALRELGDIPEFMSGPNGADRRERDISFSRFRMLLRYPDLVPYMACVSRMDPDTLKKLAGFAKDRYGFRNTNDFLMNWFVPLRGSFAIDDTAIRPAIGRAERKAGRGRYFEELEKEFGPDRSGLKLPLPAYAVYVLAFWPVLAARVLLTVLKAVAEHIRWLAVPAAAAVFVLLLPFASFFTGIDGNLLEVLKEQFAEFARIRAETPAEWRGELLYSQAWGILVVISLYIVLPVLAYRVFSAFASGFAKSYDWDAHKRTFRRIVSAMKTKVWVLYREGAGRLAAGMLPYIAVNAAGSVILAVCVRLAVPAAWGVLSEFLRQAAAGLRAGI